VAFPGSLLRGPLWYNGKRFLATMGESDMPSPLPGMDPFLEAEEWEDFHNRFNNVLADALSPCVEPRYYVRIERRVYVEHAGEDGPQLRRADVAVLRGETGEHGAALESSTAVATVAPVPCVLPMPEERRETYLVIREQESREVVTVIETLSPANKRRGGEGRREYLRKREEVLDSETHLVELDLLRGGERLPVVGSLPPGDYYAVVSRAYRRPRAEVYPWTLRHRLPAIPVPLAKGEPDVPIDLQAVFDTVYDRARYQLSVDYRQALEPPLSKEDAQWLAELLAKQGA